MKNSILIKVLGFPRPQPRPRFVKGKAISTLDKKAQQWGAAVRYATQQAVTDLGGIKVAQEMIGGRSEPLTMKVAFFIGTKNKSRHGTLHSVPSQLDLDNLEKLVMDVMLGKKESPLGASQDGRIAHKIGVKIWSSYADAKCIAVFHRAPGVDEILKELMI